MSSSEPNPIEEFQTLLDQLEAITTVQQEIAGSRVIYRPLGNEELIDDSIPIEEPSLEADNGNTDLSREDFEIPIISDFHLSDSRPIAAVDSSIVRLGETEHGLVIALRAALVIDQGDNTRISLFRTGPIFLHNQRKMQTLYHLGCLLGKPDLFVKLDSGNQEIPTPIRIKDGAANDAHQYSDRFRNLIERIVQRIAVSSIQNGTILFDGALTLRTYDTPQIYLEQLAQSASDNGNSIIAISKQSILQIKGKPIRFWLNDVPNHACYRWLMPLLGSESAERILGNLYAIRLSPLGPTFRMDVKPSAGRSHEEAINCFYSSALMRGGYPDILVRAHAHSYFTSPDVVQLQSYAGARYGLIPQKEISLTGIFAPFGGRFK